MEQLDFLSENIRPTSCVFTGHRQLGEDFSQKKLKKEIEKAIKEGVVAFYNGMAMGFDLIAAETVLKFKKKYPTIKLIACVPCYGQEKNFSDTDKRRYAKILKKADETIVLSDHYYNGCMHTRDRYMADRANLMITYCKKETGGTAYTVNYFKRKSPSSKIIFI